MFVTYHRMCDSVSANDKLNNRVLQMDRQYSGQIKKKNALQNVTLQTVDLVWILTEVQTSVKIVNGRLSFKFQNGRFDDASTS
jgi:hypothetical protein